MQDNLTVGEALDKLEKIEDWDDMNDPDDAPVAKEEEGFASELFDLIQSLVCIDDVITEEYISKNCLNKHYAKHCLDGVPNRKSSRTDVYYDFKNRDKYRVYCDTIVADMLNTKYKIFSLLNVQDVYKSIRRLFEGESSILFEISCGFTNNTGGVSIGVHAFASSVTKNYAQNTLDLAIIARNNKTISVYPVDANYFETKFNNLIKTYTNQGVSFKINH